jgi:hypothetical protein
MGEKTKLRSILMPLALAVSSLLASPVAGQSAAGTNARIQEAQVAAKTQSAAAPQAVLTASGQEAMAAGPEAHGSHRSHSSHRSHRSSAL